MQKEYRLRIAPSPTGSLHLGTVRTALYNYLFVKRHSGKFILRIEDTDLQRNKEEYTRGIIQGFNWLNIKFDEGPFYQSERLDIYKNSAEKLLSEGKAYHCFCTPEELDEIRKIQKASGKPEKYDNRHRNLTEEEKKKYLQEGRKPVVRFKFPDHKDIKWHDEVRGDVSVNSEDLGGDPVIMRADGIPLYNFAVVIDDGDMNITHVIRGDDHLHNTAKQIPIFEALGFSLPIFGHVPLIFTQEREKLSKRKHGDIANIAKYQNEGYLPEALSNYLIHMSWTRPDNSEIEIFTIDEAAPLFEFGRISKSAAVYDLDKLNWFNNHYIKHKSSEEVYMLSKHFLERDLDLSSYSQNEILKMIEIVKDGANKLDEMPSLIKFFFNDDLNYSSEENKNILYGSEVDLILEKFKLNLDSINFSDPKECKKSVDDIGKELNIKGKNLYWPIRVAISGSNKGPDLGMVISILGKERIKIRLNNIAIKK